MTKEKTYILKKDCPRLGKEIGDYYNGEYGESIEELLEKGVIEEEIPTIKETEFKTACKETPIKKERFSERCELCEEWVDEGDIKENSGSKLCTKCHNGEYLGK